ncbi:hypothetical protein TNCV_533171 [Trichonephila clavipes]|nr:hypothetical protein TNCV_533171 [Trichonephila clavipes]
MESYKGYSAHGSSKGSPLPYSSTALEPNPLTLTGRLSWQDRVTHSLKGYNAILRYKGSATTLVTFHMVFRQQFYTVKFIEILQVVSSDSLEYCKLFHQIPWNIASCFIRFLGILQVVSSDSLEYCKLFHQIPWGHCKLFHQIPWNIASCFIRFLGILQVVSSDSLEYCKLFHQIPWNIASCFIRFLGILQVVSSDSLGALQVVSSDSLEYCKLFHQIPWNIASCFIRFLGEIATGSMGKNVVSDESLCSRENVNQIPR